MILGLVEGFCSEVYFCPFCGGEVSERCASGKHTCKECGKEFYVVED